MSKSINISNYELYAMDYIDGTLSAELKEAFDAFLILNPEIADEISAIEDIENLSSVAVPSFDKNKLKIDFSSSKLIGEENYAETIIASIDHELDQETQSELEKLISINPVLQEDYNLYEKAVLKPDLKVTYPFKSALKKPIPLWQNTNQIIYRAAAIMVVGLGSITIWNTINQELYIPRAGVQEYSMIESIPNPEVKKVMNTLKDDKAETNLQLASQTSSKVQNKRPKSIAEIPRIDGNIIEKESTIESRELLAYQPRILEWKEPSAMSTTESNSELNLAQFVGKQFFGLDPEKTPTTRELMKEGIIKTIDDRDNLELRASESNSEKKSIEFLAGNFGFKRVSYK